MLEGSITSAMVAGQGDFVVDCLGCPKGRDDVVLVDR